MTSLPVLEDLPDPAGKHVLVRTDFNVPLENGEIVDDMRIRAAVPTLEWLLDQDARVTACSHLGRPKGAPDPKYDMESVRKRLAELVPGVDLQENLRFDPGETANDPAFVDRLIDGVDLYVNDAFGASHREHASVVGPPTRLPSAAGRLLAKEVQVLGGLLHGADRPFVAVLGGAKVSDKLGVIRALVDKVDTLIVGGAMCFTFFKAMGHEVGDSLLEPDMVETCRELWATDTRIKLPIDVVVLDEFNRTHVVNRDIPEGMKGLDIGSQSIGQFNELIAGAGTVLWNGPMGLFEDERFATGTRSVAYGVAESPAFTVVGGGDSAAALKQFRLADRVDHVSTGGGASLEFIEKGDLPGLAALRKASNAA